MLAIIAVVLAAIVAVAVLSFAVHVLFVPLLLVGIGALVWMKVRPRSHRQ